MLTHASNSAHLESRTGTGPVVLFRLARPARRLFFTLSCNPCVAPVYVVSGRQFANAATDRSLVSGFQGVGMRVSGVRGRSMRGVRSPGSARWLRGMSGLLALLLMSALLVACGGDDDDDGSNGVAGTADVSMATALSTTAMGGSATAVTDANATMMAEPVTSDEEVSLTIGVAMTPPELATFQAGLDALMEAHPNWKLTLEQTPQEGIIEKMNAQIAGDDLPDIVQVQGLMAQQWIRNGVFLDLSTLAADEAFNVDDFWGGALEQFSFADGLYAIPNTVAPDVVYINQDMFDAAGVPYPTDDWTFEDLRDIARQLTLDSDGNTPDDPNFDPTSVVQWGLNVTPSNIWARHFLLPFDADPCVNVDCTEVLFDTPEVIEALEWWTALPQEDYSAPYDPYSGNQTGVPGDPFSAGLAAMGYNGFFLVGQLNATDTMRYDVVQPPIGPNGERATVLSTNGWAIPATTGEQADAAWAVIRELTSDTFLREYWAAPGHAVPARASSADAILTDAAPENQQAILAALDYATVFRPYTASAFEVYGRTAELFARMMSGDLSIAEAVQQIDEVANSILVNDREE